MKYIVTYFLLFCLISADDFSDFKQEIETKVQGLADEMEAIFARRCENAIATC